MFPAPWVCRRCATALAKPLGRQFLRYASTDAAAPNLPPALLQRARNLAAEHAALATTLEQSFDAKAAKRLGELSRHARANNEPRDGPLGLLTPRDPYAQLPCLVEIRPGPGGQEGRYFADAVYKMYRAYCVRVGLRANTVKYEVADGAETAGGGAANESPLAEAVLEVLDEGAYDHFRSEAGMHRVQRVPATEKQGRTHTSAVAVWVLPSFPASDSAGSAAMEADFDNPDSDFYIDPKDVRSEKMRAGGAGGQHVNKTESAIRLTHIPTGTVVSMQDSRSQHRNREDAWRLLRSRVAAQRREEQEKVANSLRNSVLAKNQITRGDKIRTYNYQQDRCTDHRSGVDVHNLPDVLLGGETLGRLMESARSWLVGRDVQALIAEEEIKAAEAEKGQGNGNGGGKKKK
ncbi:peptide chain release factor 1 [Apiospora hydei]|uniref:Peptide chain release factor 1 n=1 Tax=Apiospora hydei TaxID=1337664 RepID=A0ABR1VLZ2_9PEZI